MEPANNAISNIDLLIVGIVVLSAGLGIVSGFVMQLAGLASMAAGVVATFVFGEAVAEVLGRWIESPGIAGLVAYLGTFSVAATVVRVLAALCSTLLKKFRLQKMERVLGGVLGAVKGLAIAAVIVIIMDRVGTEGSRGAVQNSRLASPILQLADFVARKADEADVTEKGRQALERIREAREQFGAPTEPASGSGEEP